MKPRQRLKPNYELRRNQKNEPEPEDSKSVDIEPAPIDSQIPDLEPVTSPAKPSPEPIPEPAEQSVEPPITPIAPAEPEPQITLAADAPIVTPEEQAKATAELEQLVSEPKMSGAVDESVMAELQSAHTKKNITPPGEALEPPEAPKDYASLMETELSKESLPPTPISATLDEGEPLVAPVPNGVLSSDEPTKQDEPANDGVEYSSFLGSDDASVLGGTLTYGYNYEKDNKTGEYVITPSGLTADNYEINFVSGTLTVEAKKTTFAAIQIFEDENGKRAEIAGEYDGPDAVNITEDIKNVAVTFDRVFTPNSGYATIMLPFDVNATKLTGVRSVIEFDGIKTDKNDNKMVGMRYVWCNATLGEQEELNKHPNCNGYSGELKAYTPYMIEMDSPTLGIKDAVTLKSNSGKIVGDAPVGNWVFRGTLQKKEWPKGTGIINEGRLWAFSAAERSGAKIGEFVQFGGNNWANPFRAYLVECKKSGEDSWDCEDDSEPQPKASQVARYRFADALAPTNSAEKLAGAVATDEPLVMRQAAASETASLNSMDIVIVYGDKDSDQERPTVIGRFNPATGEIRMLPRTKQTYDLKGRKVGNGKKAKGAYYNRR